MGPEQTSRKRICFITGVPGSGKTLAGLNIVHNRKLHDGDLGIFLSGNGPLVRVLTEALARDGSKSYGAEPAGVAAAASARSFRTSIISLMAISETHRECQSTRSSSSTKRSAHGMPPNRRGNSTAHSRSQKSSLRSWTATPIGRRSSLSSVGGRRSIVGEAGLVRVGQITCSPVSSLGSLRFARAQDRCPLNRPMLVSRKRPEGISISENASLHLSVNLRSYKAEVLSEFVDATPAIRT